ncbi:hypothetical protein LCGC14_3065420, partial [marine sediment metagenome]
MKLESSKSSTTDKPRKPERVLADRIKRDLADYERLKKKVEEALYHHSDGVWGWVTDTVSDAWEAVTDAASSIASEITSAASDVWDSVTDTASNVESWVTETADTVTSAAADAWGWVNDVVDTYVWDTDADVAVIEGWAKDTWDWIVGDAEGEIVGVIDTIKEGGKEAIDDVVTAIERSDVFITDSVTEWVADLKELINTLKAIFGTLFDSALGAITLLPELLVELFTIDETKYVDDGITMMKLNSQLSQRLREVEG